MSRIRFNIKKPKAGGRATFAVVRQEAGKRAVTIRDERIAAVNKQFADGALLDTCLAQIKDIKDELLKEEQRKRPQRVRLRENFDLFEKFWRAHYVSRPNVDLNSARNDFLRAVEVLGQTPLLTSPAEELQAVVDGRFDKKENEKQRRVVSRLNELLEWARPAIVLRKWKPSIPDPVHISEAELDRVLAHIEDGGYRALIELAFCSGLREGELMALTERSRRGEVVEVAVQVDRDGVRRETKNRVSRKAYLLPRGVAAFNMWAKVPDKEQYRGSTDLQRICQKLFSDKLKHCSLHCLRHSYAIHLLSRGVSLSLVAQALGNSVVVCQRYYTGFVLNDEGMKTISRLLRSAG